MSSICIVISPTQRRLFADSLYQRCRGLCQERVAMPNFFKKLFRRKASSEHGKKKLSRKERKALKKAKKNGSFIKTTSTTVAQDVQVSSSPIHNDEVIRKPSFGTSTSSTMSGHISPVGRVQPQIQEEIDFRQHQTHPATIKSPTQGSFDTQNEYYPSENLPVYNEDIERFHQLQTNNNFLNESNVSPSMNFPHEKKASDPFVTNFAQFHHEKTENMGQKAPVPIEHGSLDYSLVQKHEMHEAKQSMINYNPYEAPQSKKMQLSRLSNGQLVAMDRFGSDLQSPMSASSEFDLSTDAEDNEYNQIRRAAANNLSPMLETAGSNSENNSDDDVGLNPVDDGLQHRKNNHYLSNSESESEDIDPEVTAMNRSKHYFSDSDNEGGLSQLSPIQSSGQQQSVSNSASTDREEMGVNVDDNNRFTFERNYSQQPAVFENNCEQQQHPVVNEELPVPNESSSHSSSLDKSFNTAMSPRTLAIRQTKKLMAQGKLPADLYPDSTDSEFEVKERKEYNHPKDLLPPRNIRSGEDDSAISSKSDRSATPKMYESSGVIENFADFETMNPNPSHKSNSKSVAESSPVSELISKAKEKRNMLKESGNGNGSVNSAPLINAAALRNYHSLKQSRNERSSSNASAAAKEKLRRRRKEKEAFLRSFSNDTDDDSVKENENRNAHWVFEDNTGVLGAQGIAADLESLGNKSRTSTGNKSYRSHRSHRSSKSARRKKRSDESVGSRHSRNSKYSIKSRSSEVSEMSQQSRSVANDLLRLEMQLAMVGSKSSSGEGGDGVKKQKKTEPKGSIPDSNRNNSSRTVSMTKRVRENIVAPAGKLGIILANKTDAKGTVVSGVRTTSVMANDITPGDRIIAIDGEDVSRMTVTEITAIMARKSDFERVLTVLTTPKRQPKSDIEDTQSESVRKTFTESYSMHN